MKVIVFSLLIWSPWHSAIERIDYIPDLTSCKLAGEVIKRDFSDTFKYFCIPQVLPNGSN